MIITPKDSKTVVTSKHLPQPKKEPVVTGDTAISTTAPVATAPETTPKVGQTDTTEGTPKPGEATDPNLDPKFANLARKEKTLRQVQKTLQSEREAFQNEKAAWEKSRGKQLSLDDLKTNPLLFLAQAGVSYNSLVEQLLGQQADGHQTPKVDPESAALQARIDSLEAKLAKAEENQTKSQSKAYDNAISQLRSETRELVDNSEAYETIKATESYEQVIDLIKTVYEEEGEVLSVEAAAREIEDVLLEEKWSEHQRLSETKKWKAKLTPPTTPDPTEIVTKQSGGSQGSKTLTNAMSTSGNISRRDRAILAFKNQLPK